MTRDEANEAERRLSLARPILRWLDSLCRARNVALRENATATIQIYSGEGESQCLAIPSGDMFSLVAALAAISEKNEAILQDI